MRRNHPQLVFLWLLSVCAFALNTVAEEPRQPRRETYRQVAGQTLSVYLFLPDGDQKETEKNGVLLFHGGGWNGGTPEWTFEAARRFSEWGLVAVSVQYRLSGDRFTPMEALDDVCAAFRWTRNHAGELGLSDRLAGYGVSAGGHLVALAATLGCPGGTDGTDAGPDALLLWSPALDVRADRWFSKMLQGRAKPSDYSPVGHVQASTPPTSIVHGAADTLTPLSGAERFCEQLVREGQVCELHVYEGVGHLLTRNLAFQEGDFDPDPQARSDGIEQHRRFLAQLSFLPPRSE